MEEAARKEEATIRRDEKEPREVAALWSWS